MDELQAVVEWIDPDWGDHFQSVEDAAENYQRYSHREWCEAYREVTGEQWHEI